jgi:hypothetical protein
MWARCLKEAPTEINKRHYQPIMHLSLLVCFNSTSKIYMRHACNILLRNGEGLYYSVEQTVHRPFAERTPTEKKITN